jgi:thiol-disulfide isomerase/thioredoxin
MSPSATSLGEDWRKMKSLCRNALVLAVLAAAQAAGAQERADLATEKKVVEYLKGNVKPGEPLVVSDLYNRVFTAPEERKVLDRLFNTFFKMPIFVAQYKASTGQVPSLADIARQFNLTIPGEAAVLLTIMDSDPRVPKFITRDQKSGEIVSVDIEAVRKDRRFGQLIERTLAGWAGKDAPQFQLELFGGQQFSSGDLKGKTSLLYFWFSGCPPCVRISPHLVELQKKYSSRNFTVVAVNADRVLELDTTDSAREAYVRKVGYNFPVGHLNKPMQQAFGNVNVYPTLFLVDSRGVIQKQYVNYQPLDALSADVEAALGRQ